MFLSDIEGEIQYERPSKGVSGMNRDILEGKWRQIRGQVKTQWGKLTDDELDEIEGNVDLLVGKIQEKYGQTRAEIERDLDMLLSEEPSPRMR